MPLWLDLSKGPLSIVASLGSRARCSSWALSGESFGVVLLVSFDCEVPGSLHAVDWWQLEIALHSDVIAVGDCRELGSQCLKMSGFGDRGERGNHCWCFVESAENSEVIV
eukprot:4408981-Amphidinium_carterae.1